MEGELIDLTAGPRPLDIESASAKALRRFISSRGLRHDDCVSRANLLARAQEAKALASPPVASRGSPMGRRRKRPRSGGGGPSSSSSSSSSSRNDGGGGDDGDDVLVLDSPPFDRKPTAAEARVLGVFPTVHRGFLAFELERLGGDPARVTDRLASSCGPASGPASGGSGSGSGFPVQGDEWRRPAAGGGEESVECGCCFGEARWGAVAQCSEGEHLFCLDCLKHFAEEKLFGQNTTAKLM